MSVSSFYPKTNKLLVTSLRLLLAALANINDSSNNNNKNNRAAGTIKINVMLNRFGSFWSCVSRKPRMYIFVVFKIDQLMSQYGAILGALEVGYLNSVQCRRECKNTKIEFRPGLI